MHLRRAALLAVAALVLAATPSLADMVIKLQNGQVITVPGSKPGDIESLSFTGSKSPVSGTAAPITLSPAQPLRSRPHRSPCRAVAPIRRLALSSCHR